MEWKNRCGLSKPLALISASLKFLLIEGSSGCSSERSPELFILLASQTRVHWELFLLAPPLTDVAWERTCNSSQSIRGKGGIEPESFPCKCSVDKCSCEVLAAPQLRASHLPALFSLRLEEASLRGICILRWNSSKPPKICGVQKRERKRHWVRSFQTWWQRERTILPPIPASYQVSPRKPLELILKWVIGNGFGAEF